MRTIANHGLIFVFLLLLLAACTQPKSTSPTPTVSPTPTTVLASSTNSKLESDKTPDLPARAFAMFPTNKLGTQSDSLPVPGGDVIWDTTDYGVVRFVPEVPQLDIMASTSSKSYSKSYVYAVTNSGKLFVVRVGTDALYWLERSGPGAVKIIRYPLNSVPKPIVTLPYDDLYNIGIDE